jgi:hypothetical protein
MAIQNWPKTNTSGDWASVDGIVWSENQAANTVNDSARAMGRDIAKWLGDTNATLTTGGSSNAYTLTSNGSFTSLANGFVVAVKANHSNTGAATLNVDSLGAKAIRKFTGSGEAALSANDIVNGGHYILQYNTAANSASGGWIVINPNQIATGDINDDAVTYAKIQNVSTNNRLLGRATSGAGNVEEITVGNGLSVSGTTISGKIAQFVSTSSGAVATGATILPGDDSIPQNTEGNQYLSRAITPTSASSTLIIDVVVNISHTASGTLTAALFQDSTANALACSGIFTSDTGALKQVAFRHIMTAGTTSSTTFNVRCGGSSAGTMTFNGASGGRIFGGVFSSSIAITEVLP